MRDTNAFRPGFVVLHGNRLEDLAEVALDWLARHPLGPLDEETLLVPSSGMGEWLKGAMATRHGVAAGFTMELPARFVWRAWRAVLGEAAVPVASPLDKAPLTWWLMRLLPELAARPVFAPLAGFLATDGSVMRRLELAQRLADLYDQYQVYRPDWLADWAAGHDRLARAPVAPAASAVPLPPGQRWQAALWRALLAELGTDAGALSSRPALHARFIGALNGRPEGSPPPGLPPRLLLFGTTHLPHTTLEALAALARHIPVLLAVPDPCAHAWVDEPEDAETTPALLQAWGRQCRDFVRQLNAHDDGQARAEQLGFVRTALFDSGPGQTLLQQLQARIRDRTPSAEAATKWQAADRSLQFHTAHGPLREVELLHDQLLEAFATSRLEPREVVVMVPDIERFAPAIAAVFGRFAPGHPRHVPWGLADRRERGRHALLRALEALLQVRERRWAGSELRDLLGTPAVAARLGLNEGGVEQLAEWLAGAGLRWGLHEAQRAALGLQAAGAVGSARFALDRLLMGYATGALPPEAEAPGGIDPWPEVAGLESALAGVLAQWLQAIDAWWAEAAEPRPPQAWLPRLRALLTAMFSATDDRERTLLAVLDEALQSWVAACDAAGFAEPVSLELVREAWLDGVDEAGGGRFRAGGVTFCTLLPLRAIPFRWVCLLGMNDGEYPRPASRSDFDLMADPALARPGDRSRRDDDRQLMLDALLAARDRLHVSWSAHAARDNQPQPPSVLVAQLHDHVQALWGEDVLKALTVAHPLQPFSRAYVEEGGDARLFTYASEWRALHEPVAALPSAASLAPPVPARSVLTLRQLADFVRSPVAAYFRERLRTDLRLHDDAADDDEPFTDQGLEGWQWRDELLRSLQQWMQNEGALAPAAEQTARARRVVARLQREGRLPWGGPGEAAADALVAALVPGLQEWGRRWAAGRAPDDERLELPLIQGLRLEPGALAWRIGTDGEAELLDIGASRLTVGKVNATKKKPRADKLVAAWLQQLVLAAAGRPARLFAIGADVVVMAQPLDTATALEQLAVLVQAWRDGVDGVDGGHGDGPWPTVLNTGLAFLAEADLGKVFNSSPNRRGDDQDVHLLRLYPSLGALTQAPHFEPASRLLYTPLQQWLATLHIEPLANAAPAEDDGDDGEGSSDD
jgi:exodeoxyribonuclease V gamma subunit